MLHSNRENRSRKFALLSVKIVAVFTVIAALLITFAGPHMFRAHADSPTGTDFNSLDASSLATNSPSTCLVFDPVQSQLNGAAPAQFVSVPNIGQIEIDDTVYANGCSATFSSQLIMSGLVYVHWTTLYSATGTAPTMTVSLQSQVTVNAIQGSWSAGVSANAGANAATGSAPGVSAGATATINFTLSPNSSTIANSTQTISNQQSAYFSYQNLSASALTAVDGNVTQNDTITIQIPNNPQVYNFPLQVVTLFS